MRDFLRACQERFKYLEFDFNCSVIAQEEDGYGSLITYKNATTGVRIGFEWGDRRIFVQLVRLRNGEIPPYPFVITPDMTLDLFNLMDMVAVRDKSASGACFNEVLADADIDLVLGDCADKVRRYASDVLRGDFDIFPLLERRVKDRIKS